MIKYIPGNPNIFVQDMPGAGSAVAANFVHGVAAQNRLHPRLLQMGKKREQLIPDVPTLNELMDQYQTPAPARRLTNAVAGTAEFGAWPMMASPNTPADHVKTLRAAFTKAVNDPELLAEAKKKTMDVELITGEETEALAKEVVNQPAEIVARLKKLLGE
jgi:hypothetical protein